MSSLCLEVVSRTIANIGNEKTKNHIATTYAIILICSKDDLSKLNKLTSGIKKNSSTKYKTGRIATYPKANPKPETYPIFFLSEKSFK